MPDIPVLSSQCESEQDKFLYNIWQTLIGGVLIPGIVSPDTPLGWDVHSTTNQLLYNILLNIGGGGGGGGTVTSVGATSQSLNYSPTTPNPIIGAGDISFELKIVDILFNDLVAENAGGTLMPDVTYRVTDFDVELNDTVLEVACFNTIRDFSGNYRVDQKGVAFNGDNKQFQIVFDVEADTLLEVYNPELNLRLGRSLSSGANCIEVCPVVNPNGKNVWIYETNLYNPQGGGSNVIQECRIFHSTIDFNGTQADIYGGTQIDKSIILFTSSDAYLDGCIVNPYCVLEIGHNTNKCIFEQGATVTTVNGSNISGMRFGVNSIAVIPADVLGNMAYDPALVSMQKVTTVNGGDVELTDTFCTMIAVNVAGSNVASMTINFPPNPKDRQLLFMSFGAQIETLTLTGNGHGLAGSPVSVIANSCTYAWVFTDADDEWLLI